MNRMLRSPWLPIVVVILLSVLAHALIPEGAGPDAGWLWDVFD